jgi:hypothetical protein
MYLAPTADPPHSPTPARSRECLCRGGKRSKVSPRGALNLPGPGSCKLSVLTRFPSPLKLIGVAPISVCTHTCVHTLCFRGGVRVGRREEGRGEKAEEGGREGGRTGDERGGLLLL